MALKNAKLTRAEYLSAKTRQEYALPDTGLVVIETLNPDLRETMRAIGSFYDYLHSLGAFNEHEIAEEGA